MLSASVTRNSTSPSAKAASVLGLSNSWSPVSSWTIWVVTVVTLSNGLRVRLAARPAAITTIIVSPIARLTASRTPPTTPGSAGGTRTLRIVSDVVAPIASEPSRIACGTAAIESSAIDETNGMIMIPITRPAASADSVEDGMPSDRPRSRIAGATVRAAK